MTNLCVSFSLNGSIPLSVGERITRKDVQGSIFDHLEGDETGLLKY